MHAPLLVLLSSFNHAAPGFRSTLSSSALPLLALAVVHRRAAAVLMPQIKKVRKKHYTPEKHYTAQQKYKTADARQPRNADMPERSKAEMWKQTNTEAQRGRPNAYPPFAAAKKKNGLLVPLAPPSAG